ncbi:MAG: protein kinase, partial [Gemmatimonadota bacterium]|nr:protein kinase [Gemmatimonadota bacterium]
GVVYRAWDERLERQVALKFLAPEAAEDEEGRRRLLREARALSTLDHPNVCTVHEVGETARGRPFIAMALYEGETLKERIGRGPLPVDEAVRTAVGIASALDVGHRRGIVHRDVKPGNVMLTEDGGVRLLDFGLAKAADAELTQPGRIPGTVAYMAPEHLRGEPVDGRADLWSLGVVLFEMLTGTRLFRGGADGAVVHAILESDPPSLATLRHDAPEHVVRAVERLLRKDRAERYGSAAELLEDLGANADLPPSPGARGSPLRRPALGVAVAAGLAALVAVVGWLSGPGAGTALDDDRVAVLPFRVAGADPSLSYLREGMLDLFATKLSGGGGLRPVDQRALTGLLERRHGGSDPAPEEALGVAADLGAGRLVLGEVVSLPDRVVLTASLWNVHDGSAEPPVSVEGPVDSLAALVDRLVGGVLSVDAGEGDRLASLTTDSLEALRHFLAGQAAYRAGRYDSAARAFVRAYEIDTTFALAAFKGWGATLRVGGVTAPTSVTYMDAWRHRDRLGPRDREFLERFVGPNPPGTYSSRAEILASRRELVRRQPERPEAWHALAQFIPAGEGPHVADDSLVMARTYDAFARALEVDPDFLPALEWLWFQALVLGDEEAAADHAEGFLARSPTGLAAETIRCVRAALDPSASFERDVVGRVDSGGSDLAGRCVATLYNLGGLRPSTEVSTARDALAAHLTRRLGDEPGLLRIAGDVLTVIANDGGRPAEAARIEEARLRAGFVDSVSYLTARVRNGLWWDGDRKAADEAARRLVSRLERTGPNSFGVREADVLCVLGQWRLASHRD